ncbi:ABC transporter permease [Brachybacterium saurashtrense]|uniref:ABC transporter permease n=1 Tax=Brachybacterium saurashtrense TaxID=556288 RepID=A0A345YKB5_9MICO|nr:ABC transporter permease [Brachybacterium saurashtrense]AXK44367.1 ABC transporter permease [Brachybacterium saurashtrense]RRR21309.1 ABC transporter permease [Brachybacterium saurashtrense]RRR22978.1 ABC transporter permease [Brachybacterium saurashtrense]
MTAPPLALPRPAAAARRGLAARRYGAFALRRSGQALLVIAGAYALVFLVLAAIPGDPISAQLDNPQNGYSEAEKAQIRAFHGLDRPVPVQLLVSVGAALQGDLGTSLSTSQPVTALLGAAIPSTLALAATALVLAILLAAVLGLLSRLLPEGPANSLVRALPAVFLSTPNFLIGLVLIQVLAVQLGLFSLVEPESPLSTLAAALTLAIPVSAQIAQVFITALDESAGQDFAEVALARGLPPARVVVRHLLRPSLLPTVTIVGLVLGEVLGGSLITETIFGRSGVGTVVQKAVTSQDVPVLLAAVVLSAAVFVVVNLVIDLLYPLLDPRLRAPEETR